jgi:YebC/PmpR family DNA-binding regulatory protein
MPAENIDRAVKKGTGELEGVDYQEITYEGYGPGGVALYIETLTDNANRTVSDIRYVLSRNDGSMGTSGSVAWQFERKGQIYVSATRYDEDTTLMAALEAGAEDLRRDDDIYVITTELTSFTAVQDALRAAGIEIDQAELAMIAKNTVDVGGADAQKLLKLLDALDDLDDVQKVHSNADIDEAAYAEARTRDRSRHRSRRRGTGYGVVARAGGGAVSLLECGVIRTDAASAAAASGCGRSTTASSRCWGGMRWRCWRWRASSTRRTRGPR